MHPNKQARNSYVLSSLSKLISLPNNNHLLPVFLSYIFYCVNNHAFVVLFFVSSCGCVHCLLPLEPHERAMYKSAPVVDRQQANRTCMHVQIITIIHTHTTVLYCIVLLRDVNQIPLVAGQVDRTCMHRSGVVIYKVAY